MKTGAIYNLAYCGLTLSLSGCASYYSEISLADRDAVAMKDDYYRENVNKIVYAKQNWTPEESLWFYNTSQGSHLMNYDVFVNLEQDDSDQLFRSSSNMARYRYLPQKSSLDRSQNPTQANPDGLPVGWVKDTYQGKDYVGFTCAACHTAQINYKSTGIRVDGAPAMADMEGMLYALQNALEASLKWEKFDRLAGRILGDQAHDHKQRQALQIQLTKDFKYISKYNCNNKPLHGESLKIKADYISCINKPMYGKTPKIRAEYIPYGYSRLDAFGRIFNQVFEKVSSEKSFEPRAANAPVSYPALWDTPQHDYVQWNGIGANARAYGLGALGRNTGEVIGVFATFDIDRKSRPHSIVPLYPSSARSKDLVNLERSLRTLWSPSWPELAKAGVLPAVNDKLAEKGREIFERACDGCHGQSKVPLKGVEWRTWPERKVQAQFQSLSKIGTDPKMAINAIDYCGSNDGPLISTQLAPCPDNRSGVLGLSVLEHVTQGVVAEGFLRNIAVGVLRGVAYLWDYGFVKETPPEVDGDPSPTPSKEQDWTQRKQLRAYKARPLNGVWATAPYLHNGSVPNLYEMLLPVCDQRRYRESGVDCRSKKFTVGSLSFDDKKVGFESKGEAGFGDHRFPKFDTAKPGNSNAGHIYPETPLEEEDRRALVEYLKTL